MYGLIRRRNQEPIKSIDFLALSHPSQEMTEYEMNKGVCEGYKNKSDMEKYD